MSETKHVYKAIAAVSAAMSKHGVGKNQVNEQQRYRFRGIDDIYNALAPALAEHGLCILPRVLNRECTERHTKSGGVLFYVTVEVEFDFVAAEDGSSHTICTYGEAMDSGDKATNKAMSAAYKYAAIQTFCLPTIGEQDVAAAEVASSENAVEQAIRILTDSKSMEALAANWQSEFVQSVRRNGSDDDKTRVTKAKDERKAALSA